MNSWRRIRIVFLSVFLVGGLPHSGLAHGDLTFVTWTGSYMRSQILGFVRPFEQLTGKSVTVEHYAGGIDEIRDQVESANVIWDVVDMTEADVLRACEQGLLETLDNIVLPDGSDGTPFSEDFVDGAISKCGIGGIRWSTAFSYDSRVFGEEGPSTIRDFFDVEKFPGPRAARRDPSVLMEWALMADGVSPQNVYATLETDEGLERAFEMLDKIRPGILWWSYEREPIRYIEEGLATVSAVWTVTGTEHARLPESNMRVVTNGAITEMDLYAIPKGTRRLEEALEFIRYASSSEALSQQARYQPLEPTRRSAFNLIPEDVRSAFATGPDSESESVLASDAGWWAANYDRISERFEEWAMQSVRQGAKGGVR